METSHPATPVVDLLDRAAEPASHGWQRQQPDAPLPDPDDQALTVDDPTTRAAEAQGHGWQRQQPDAPLPGPDHEALKVQ
ncbi:hypothetical protein [Streptomyces sp. MZ04]|uniref:hypothetical protein n=1 Tax=Streptomyces sp. MZ04 TaxID=2559236 RepID=UPI00107E9FE6|nr:hypothetical protein [Streptomyces sp. MZ04]TGB13176.1 hypothetical protein E2651_10080 [Streptomyces sp. MZ04]